MNFPLLAHVERLCEVPPTPNILYQGLTEWLFSSLWAF